jgi:hypothetical protein
MSEQIFRVANWTQTYVYAGHRELFIPGLRVVGKVFLVGDTP